MPTPSTPSWWQQLKNKLNQLGTPAGLGGGVQVPKIPTTTTVNKTPKPSWWQQLNNIPVGGTPSPIQSTSLPAWLQPKPPIGTATPGYQTFAPADTYNAGPPKTPLLTSSFIGGGGNAVLGANQQAVSPIIPTGSFIGGGGQYVIGSNQQGYLRDRPIGSTTFLGAGGEAVRGPDIPIATVSGSGSGSGGGSGYGYKKKRYGGGRGYTPRAYAPSQYQDNAPAWAKSAGLANWSIG